MLKFIENLIVNLIVLASLSMGAKTIYFHVKIETLKLVSRGLPSLNEFTRKLTQKEFDWERKDYKNHKNIEKD